MFAQPMKYCELLQTFGKDFDPFVHVSPEEILDESQHFLVIPARAPYVPHHLLIIPKAKIYMIQEMNHEQWQEMSTLVEKRALALHKQHQDVNLLLRDGLVGGVSEKSINHLHFHLIPDCPVGADNGNDTENRKAYDDEEYLAAAKELKEMFG